MFASISIGILVGVCGGMYLLLTFLAIHRELSQNRLPTAAQLGSLLSFPAYVLGAISGGSALIPQTVIAENFALYIFSVLVPVFAINMKLGRRLITFGSNNKVP
jgi:hypothetical protein